MLQIILSVLLAGVPVLPRPHEDYNAGGAKINPAQPPAVVIHNTPAGQGWRIPIMSGDAHNNLIWIGPDTLAYLGADVSGSNFEGASVWYSTDNGQTWTKYNINTTVINRSYPDAYYDRTTGVAWYAYQIRVPGQPSKVYVARDNGLALGYPGIFTEYQVTIGQGTYGEWLPTVVAVGDTVVVSYIKYDNSMGACKTSFDGGNTWGNEVIIGDPNTDTLGVDNPNMVLIEPRTLVFYGFDGVNDKILRVWVSNDWGQTWQGPYEYTSHVTGAPYNFATWWYSYVGTAFQGKLHVITVMSPANYENGILFDYVFDRSNNSFTEMYVHGVVVADTDSLGNVTYRAGIPQARTPGVGVTPDGRWLVAMFMDYDTLGRKDPYFMTFDGNHWYGTAVDDPSAFAVPVFAVADTFDEGRGDFCPTVYDDGDYLHLYFVCSSQSNNYANVYFATNTLINPAVSESSTRPALALSVRPTVVTDNMNVEFALSKASNVEVSVYNVNGRKVATLFTGTLNAGSHRMTFPASFGRGIYFVNLTVDGKSTSRKVVVK